MVVSASHFKDVTNGYERTTQGLYVHRGKMQVNLNNAPRISNTGYYDGQLQIRQDTPSEPRIGFTEQGSSALALYKQQGAETLRVRGSTGTDYPLVGAAGSAQQIIGQYVGTPGWSSSATGAWLTTTISTGSIVCSGVRVRMECTAPLRHSVAGGQAYYGFMQDGVILANAGFFHAPGADYVVPISFTYYHYPSAGSHTYALGVLINSAGTVTTNPYSNSALYVTEQRA